MLSTRLRTGLLCIASVAAALFAEAAPAWAAGGITVTLSASKSVVEPGQTFVYSVRVRNGGNDASPMDITLSLDDALDAQSASDGGRQSSDTVRWQEVSIPAGSSKTFTASVRVDKKAEDNKKLYATAVAGGGFAETTVRIEAEGDENNDDERAVTVELFSDKGQVEPGEPFSFIVKLMNRGDNRVTGVDTTVELAEHLTFLSASNKGKSSGQTITWKSLDIDGDESRTLTASVRVDESAKHGESIVSTAYAEGSVHEHRIGIWDPEFGREELKLHAFAGSEETEAGGTVTYTLRVRNLADHDESADILAYIDPLTEFQSATENGQQFERTLVVWEHVAFKQSETKTFSLTARVKPSAQPGVPIRFSAQAGIDRQEIVTAVVPSRSGAALSGLFGLGASPQLLALAEPANDPRIVIRQTADKTEAPPGSLLTYGIQVENTGNTPMQNLTVEEDLGASAVAIQNGGSSTENDRTIAWSLGTLQPGETWNGHYSARLSESLQHGAVAKRRASVRTQNGLLAMSVAGTNVIEDLPQAGIGTFVFAAEAARAQLRPIVAHAASAADAGGPSSGTGSGDWMRILLWITVPLGMIAGGRAAARR